MTIYFSLLVAIIGLILYLPALTNAKITEIGRIMLWTGLLAFLLQFAPRAVSAFH